jgi:hypothetical protein
VWRFDKIETPLLMVQDDGLAAAVVAGQYARGPAPTRQGVQYAMYAGGAVIAGYANVDFLQRRQANREHLAAAKPNRKRRTERDEAHASTTVSSSPGSQ